MMDKLNTLINNPRYLGPGLNTHINRKYHTNFGKYDYNPKGNSIFEEDWDNLIILDACRLDALERFSNRLPEGNFSSRISRGSASREWVMGNFNDYQHDTVYLSTNLFYPRLLENTGMDGELHAFRAVQEEHGWEDHGEYGMTPEKTTKQAKQLNEEFPNKRLIIHYMQPHCPYMGEFGRERLKPDDQPRDVCNRDKPHVTSDVLRKAYYENLRLAIEYVNDLLPELKGKTVISADHGELLGERSFPLPVRDWGHPPGIYVPELVRVPWYEIESNNRKRIVEEQPSNGDGADKLNPDYVLEKLQELGYA